MNRDQPEVQLEARCLTCGASRFQETPTYTYADQHRDLAKWWALHLHTCPGYLVQPPPVILKQGGTPSTE